MKDVDTFSSKLQLALEKLGKTNGLAPKESQDPADADMHEYFVSKTGEAVFKRRAEQALKRLVVGSVAENADKVVALTRKNDAKEGATLIRGQHYDLTIETKKPARRISTDKIAAKLQTKHGFTADMVAKLFADCTDIAEPPKTFRSVIIRE
jgi:hypothetical protein